MAIRKRKWKTAQGVQTAWSYVFDAPGSTRKSSKQIFESGFASKKEAQDAEAARRIKEQRDYELQSRHTGGDPRHARRPTEGILQ